jgi:hypothetical protein
MESLAEVNELVDFYKSQPARSGNGIFKKSYDYINHPKSDGYRGVHLVYAYGDDVRPGHNGLRVELQIRSRLQHAWATALETVDAFTDQSLKSGVGGEKWKRFFQLMGTAIANMEGTPPIPNTPILNRELRDEIIKYESELRVINLLRGYTVAVSMTEDRSDVEYYLLELTPDEGMVKIKGYTQEFLLRANEDYLKVEQENTGKAVNVVLVSADSLKNLREGYPNYFNDTREFIKLVSSTMSEFNLDEVRFIERVFVENPPVVSLP